MGRQTKDGRQGRQVEAARLDAAAVSQQRIGVIACQALCQQTAAQPLA